MNIPAFMFSNAGLTTLVPYVVQFARAEPKDYPKVVAFWTGTALTFYTIAGLLLRHPLAYLFGTAATFCWWYWWNHGGGDNTKRRLKRLARAFNPVRRTAPAST